MTITINCDPNEVLGGGEYRAVLRLKLDEDGDLTLTATERHSSEATSMLMREWHRRDVVFEIKLSQGTAVVADPDAIADLAGRLAPLAARVRAGHTVDWDGSNMVGTLTPDAQDAADQISWIMDSEPRWTNDEAEVWNAGEWVYDLLRSEGQLTADTTDDEIEVMAKADEAMAKAEGVHLIGTTVEARRAYRDGLIERRDEEAEA